jgi:phospholipase/carboxylesterase
MRRRTHGFLLGVLLTPLLAAAPAPRYVDHPGSRVRTLDVGDGRRALVLLHGYSSAPGEWLPFTTTIHPGAGRRFVFPEGVTTGAGGHGRAWWRLDLFSHLDGTGLPDLTATRPPGLTAASSRVQTLLRELAGRLGSPPADTIVGGFSQGAMVSAEVAFRSDVPLRALVLLSPTVIDLASWRTGLAARRRLPVFVAHGRQDRVLGFVHTERFVATMREAGLTVMWVPFDGVHDMPAEVVAALNQFLRRVDAKP